MAPRPWLLLQGGKVTLPKSHSTPRPRQGLTEGHLGPQVPFTEPPWVFCLQTLGRSDRSPSWPLSLGFQSGHNSRISLFFLSLPGTASQTPQGPRSKRVAWTAMRHGPETGGKAIYSYDGIPCSTHVAVGNVATARR